MRSQVVVRRSSRTGAQGQDRRLGEGVCGCTVDAALMGEIEEFIVGSDVACRDGPCGVLSRVVIDPIADAVACLDVEAKNPRHHGHLVPISLVATATAKEIRLKSRKASFEELEPAQENEFLPGVE